MAFEPPQRLVRALGDGARGAGRRRWLAALPGWPRGTAGAVGADRGAGVRARAAAAAWSLLVRRADGTPAVLKLGTVRGRARATSSAALAHWDGWGAVRLLRADPTAGALLLERLQPRGVAALAAGGEGAAGGGRRRCGGCGSSRPPGHPFDDGRRADRRGRPRRCGRAASAGRRSVRPLVDEALAAARASCWPRRPKQVLLHGDFRQGKVLAGRADARGWRSGPEPLVGERAYDLARLVRDRVEDLVASPGAARRRPGAG